MIKKIDIAGLQLDNYTVREMIMRVDRRISEKILTTIEEVNMDTLALAEFDEEVKQSLEACDYTVIADEGILRAVSADTLQRRHVEGGGEDAGPGHPLHQAGRGAAALRARAVHLQRRLLDSSVRCAGAFHDDLRGAAQADPRIAERRPRAGQAGQQIGRAHV